MDSRMPDPEDLKDLNIARLGTPRIFSPLTKKHHLFVGDEDKVLVYPTLDGCSLISPGATPPGRVAGQKYFFRLKI